MKLVEENYYFSPSKGMVGPLTKEEAHYVFFFSGGYANISKDSTLFVNGKKTLEDIAFAIFRDEPNWYAFQKRSVCGIYRWQSLCYCSWQMD